MQDLAAMLNREVMKRSHRRGLVKLALLSILAGSLVGPMFLLGQRVASFGAVSKVIVVRRFQPPPTAPAQAPGCSPALVRSTVARAAADAWFRATDALARGARIVPSLVNGQPQGFKLYAIRPESPLAAVGFLNGDTVVRIDGVDLTSLDRALAAVARTPGAGSTVVDLVRRGCPVTLAVTLV